MAKPGRGPAFCTLQPPLVPPISQGYASPENFFSLRLLRVDISHFRVIVAVVSQTDSWLISCPAGNDPWHIYDSHSMVRVYITCEACIFIGGAITPTNTREVLPSAWMHVLTVQLTAHYFQLNLKFNWQNFLRGSWSVGFL